MTHRVVVIGGGFGGLAAVRGLRNAAVEVTLVDASNHHLFQPLLYQVATAGLAAPAIAAPLRHVLRGQRNATVLLGRVDRIDTAARTLAFDGHVLGYDTLVVATGATHAYFGHDDWAAHAPGLKTLDDAFAIRRRVLEAFEQAELAADADARRAWMTFAVIGAGPTGVELAGTLAEIARHTLRDEFRRIDPTQARVELIEAGPRALSAFDAGLSERARVQLERLGVHVRLSAPVTAIDARGLVADGTRIDARTVLWAAGVAASPLGALLGASLDRAGRVRVAPDLSVPGIDGVFVIGDLAALECDGTPVPGVAPAAKQMGIDVARRIAARVAATREPPPFRYRDQGAMATIGRHAAIARLGRLRLSGTLAWWAWLLAHVVFLIGFRNRLVVLLDWAWAYWTWQRHARVFTRDDP